MAYIVKEFCASISINVMGVEITPPKLDVEPVFIARRPIVHVLVLERSSDERAVTGRVSLTSETSDGLEMFHYTFIIFYRGDRTRRCVPWMKRKAECRHKTLLSRLDSGHRMRNLLLTSSSCSSYGDGWSPSAPSRFVGLPSLDQKLDTAQRVREAVAAQGQALTRSMTTLS